MLYFNTLPKPDSISGKIVNIAKVAQQVERRYRKPQVVGSSPTLGSMPFKFTKNLDKTGVIITAHGEVQTPVFMPVGTGPQQ